MLSIELAVLLVLGIFLSLCTGSIDDTSAFAPSEPRGRASSLKLTPIASDKGSTKRIRELGEASRSAHIKLLSRFFLTIDEKISIDRWRRAESWNGYLRRETEYMDDSSSVIHAYLKGISGAIKEGLWEDALGGRLTPQDFDFLIISGFSDITIDLLTREATCADCRLLDMMRSAAQYQEESFPELLFKRESKIAEFAAASRTVEFWLYICLIDTRSHFDRITHYLDNAQLADLKARLRQSCATGSPAVKGVLQRHLDLLDELYF